MEIWKDIVGYEGFYQVSNLGRVRSLSRAALCYGGRFRESKGRVLSSYSSGRYHVVSLSKFGVVKKVLVHRLVAESFMPDADFSLQVNHIDGDKSNNSLSNLEWVTASENITHALRTGLIKRLPKQYYNMKKPVLCVETGMVFDSISDAVWYLRNNNWSRALDSKISECANGKRHTAYGYKWKFIENEVIYS